MSEGRNVFLTGASGCVGHYVVERLLEDPRNRVHVLLRDPARLREDLLDRVIVHRGGLEDFSTFEPVLGEMDAAILLATAWGGEEARRVNVDAQVRIADALDPHRVRRLVYFSTASLLSSDGTILEQARTHGTGYICQKLDALIALSAHPLGDRIVPVFPTIIVGGDDRHPYSHAMKGLPEIGRYLPVLRRLRLDGSFHVVHPDDLARATCALLDRDPPARPVVLGNAALSVGEALSQLGEAFGLRRTAQLDITALARVLPRIVPGRFTSWDRYCLEQRHFRLPALDLEAWLGPSAYGTLADIVASDPRMASRGPSRTRPALEGQGA